MAESVLYIVGDKTRPPPFRALRALVRQHQTHQELTQFIPEFDGPVYVGRIQEKRWERNFEEHRRCGKSTTWRLARDIGDDLHIWGLGYFDDRLHGNVEAWLTRKIREWGWPGALLPGQLHCACWPDCRDLDGPEEEIVREPLTLQPVFIDNIEMPFKKWGHEPFLRYTSDGWPEDLPYVIDGPPLPRQLGWGFRIGI